MNIIQPGSTLIKAYRSRHALTQIELAVVLKVTQGLISHWETGRLLVSPAMARHLETVTRGAMTRRALRPDLVGEIGRPIEDPAGKRGRHGREPWTAGKQGSFETGDTETIATLAKVLERWWVATL